MGQLNSSQWSALCSQIQGRIKLNAENQACIDQLISDHLRAYSIETLPDLLS